jgi:nucleotide-binding universal stress UspA family protein
VLAKTEVTEMIQHILVPLDGSPLAEGSLQHAQAVARAFDARITLLRVQEPNARIADSVTSRLRRAECTCYVEALAKRLCAGGLHAVGVATEGDPTEEILRVVRDGGVDLLVLCTHGRRGPADPVAGATALKVLARTHVSVLLTRADAPASPAEAEVHYRRILVPLDCSQRAHWALLEAVPLARAQGSELLLAHVVSTPPFARRTPPSPEELALARQLKEGDRRLAEAYLADLGRMLGESGLSVRTVLLESAHVVQTLEQVAREEDVGLVVVSAHGSSGMAPWPYGSVANRLIHYGAKPLLVLQDATIERRVEEPRETAASVPAARVA